MRPIAAVFRKELTEYFSSPVAYIILVVFLVMTAFWFFAIDQFLVRGVASLRGYFAVMPVVLMLIVPALTMRSWAEEIRQGTYEGLVTLPVSPGALVVGKFAGTVALLLVMLGLTVAVPVSVAGLGEFERGEIFSQYLGILLLGAGIAAFGQLISLVTSNQIAAFLLTVFAFLGLSLAGELLAVVSLPGVLGDVARQLSLDRRFDSFNRGVVDTRDVSVLVVLTAASLYASARVLHRRRGPKRESWRERIVTLLVVTVLLLASANGEVHYRRVDLTRDRVFSLSEATLKTLRETPDPLGITYYVSPRLRDRFVEVRDIEDTLAEYAAVTGAGVRLDVVDPALLDGSDMTSLGIVPQQLQIAEAGDEVLATVYSGVRIDYLDRSLTLPFVFEPATLEYEITSAIRRIVSNRPLVIGVVTGGNLRSLDRDLSLVTGQLSRTFVVRAVRAADVAGEDADVLVVVDSQVLNGTEVDAIAAYVDRGGAVFFTVESSNVDVDDQLTPRRRAGTDVRSFLARYGLTIGRELVLDERHGSIPVREVRPEFEVDTLVPYAHWPVMTEQYTSPTHPVTGRFAGLDLFWPTWLSVAPVATDASAQIIVATSPRAWLMREPFVLDPSLDASRSPANELEAESRGQYGTVAVATGSTSSGRIAVVSDADFLSDVLIHSAQAYHNLDFAVALVGWLANDDDMVDVRTRALRDLRFDPTLGVERVEAIGAVAITLNAIVIPFGVVLAGIVRAYRRRRTGSAGTQ